MGSNKGYVIKQSRIKRTEKWKNEKTKERNATRFARFEIVTKSSGMKDGHERRARRTQNLTLEDTSSLKISLARKFVNCESTYASFQFLRE